MAITGYPVPVTEQTVRTNGIDIWCVEAGEGIPLLLFHGGTASNGPLWVNHVYGWGAYLDLFAEHFRVILPDTRGHGRTRNPGGKMSYPLFAQDYLAFIEALGLEHPLICGFSDGGTIATLIGIMAPTVPRALVDWAGYQMLNPDKNAWIYRELREWLGGSPDATQSDFDGLTSNGFDLRLRIDDFEPSQGIGYMRTYFEQIFAFWTSPMEYTFADYPRITPPMLMMFDGRDHGCRLAEAYELFQRLKNGCWHALSSHFTRWTKPLRASLPLATLIDLGRSNVELLAENALLRQQLIILKRQVKRPAFTRTDRILLVLLARLVRTWQQALLIVQPDTLLRCHRELFRLYWKRKSKTAAHTPKVAADTIALPQADGQGQSAVGS